MTPRLYRRLAVAGIALLGLVASTAASAQAAPSVPMHGNYLGLDNPSGKTDSHGRPLSRALNHTVATPRVMASVTTPTPECPPTLHCTFVPAAYQQDDPNDPSNYGNYDVANRPADGMTIDTIVKHDIEGPCEDAVKAFQDPLFYVSAQYVICPDGSVVQMVQLKNVAWHAGNYFVNMHSVGEEFAGHATTGSTDYTPAMYFAGAELDKYLAARFHFPLDRAHVIGHSEVPAPTAAYIADMHWDPGPYWNWQAANVLDGNLPPIGYNPLTGNIVTVAPIWPLNKPAVTNCANAGDTCPPVPSTLQPTSFVYLYTQASLSSPFVSDDVTGAGSTAADNVAAKAYYGEKLAVAKRTLTTSGVWYQVWYGGHLGWIYSPWVAPTIAASSGKVVVAKPGSTTISVYGRAYPDASVYPSGFSGPSVVTLPYSIAAGQQFVVAREHVVPQWYNDDTINLSHPYDHVVFTDTNPANQYIQIWYNSRQYYVKQADVAVIG